MTPADKTEVPAWAWGAAEELVGILAAKWTKDGTPQDPEAVAGVVDGFAWIISRHAPKDSWQDISTAPRDGTTILGFWHVQGRPADGNSYGITRYNEGRWRGTDFLSEETYSTPTHWQPLPAAPGKEERT